MDREWLGVSLDGTLAEGTGVLQPEVIGEPIKVMVKRVMRWHDSGIKVKIFTARVSGDAADAAQARYYIKRWLKDNIFQRLK